MQIITEFNESKVKPETAFIGKKFAYIFFGIIFSLNAITVIWFFLFANLK